MSATLTLRVYTGANAGTESSAQTAVVLISQDALSGNDVVPGTYSYERWLRLKVDDADNESLANFWLENTGTLPAGVTLRFGVTDTPATPVATASTVAITELTSGRRFFWDMGAYDADGDYTRYLVVQEQVSVSTPSGAIPQQSVEVGWAAS